MPGRGDVVWAKLKGIRWWPGIIIDPSDCGRDIQSKDWLFWFGDHKVSQLSAVKIVDFQENFIAKAGNPKSLFKVALHESLSVCAEKQNVENMDYSALLKWAHSGFMVHSSSSQKHKHAITDLPEIVVRALQNKNFKKKREDKSDSENSENEIDEILNEVRQGTKKLEDICIICCRFGRKIIAKHPLFVGGVCGTCKKNVKIKEDENYDFCIICGQGENMVYCSKSKCKSAFCKLCIEYLHSEESYLKILEESNWKCYLCSISQESGCLIEKRVLYHSSPSFLQSFFSENLSLRVISENNIGSSVFKEQKIAIDMYETESKIQNNATYKDFTGSEFAEMGANFVYGSFFSSSNSENQEMWLKSFAASLFRFVYRLNNVQLYTNHVLFIFISKSDKLDAESLERVLRFLHVDPVSVKIGSNAFYVWCNIPQISDRQNFKLSTNGGKSNEEIIFSRFIEPLKQFQQALV